MPAGSSSASSERTRRGDDPTEDTPLLGSQLASDQVTEASSLLETTNSKSDGVLAPDGAPAAPKEPAKPLDKLQIFLLCYVRMMEPIAFFSIFPFIAQMVEKNGNLPASDVGFWSGLIESLFSATQMVVLVYWGRLSDRIGRKPVLIYSLVGMAISPMLFGMATKIWQMILFRCIGGVFSGSGLIIRTMIAEHTNIETQARAFSWFAFAGNLGLFLGPILGGFFADPVHQYPNAFKGVEFFERYPFALPGFIVSAVSATAAVTSALFLKETLVKDEEGGSSQGQQTHERLSIGEILKAPGVPAVLLMYGHVMVLAFAFTAIGPIFLYMPVKLGGIGFDAFQISLFLASQGATQALWLLLVFPVIQYRLGTKRVMQICSYAYPVFFAGYPFLNMLLREGSHTALVLFWGIGSVVVFVAPGVSMNFIGVQLALNDVSPNPHVLSTLNALALTGSSAIRSVMPGLATVIYSIGVRNQILWGQLAWLVLIVLAFLLPVVLRFVPDSKIPAEEHKRVEEQAEG